MAITLDGTTGVTAAEFDGTVDASNLTGDIDASQLTGTLPAIDGSALTGIDTAPPTTAGAVGTYVFAFDSVGRQLTFGSTYAGSALYPGAFCATSTAPIGLEGNAYLSTGSGNLSGTWRSMGAHYSNTTFKNITVYVRIS